MEADANGSCSRAACIHLHRSLTEAAKGSGMSAEAWAEAQVSKRVTPVEESTVVKFYQENVGQMQGRSLEVMAPAIRRFLTEQQEAAARQALLVELRKTAPAGAGPSTREASPRKVAIARSNCRCRNSAKPRAKRKYG